MAASFQFNLAETLTVSLTLFAVIDMLGSIPIFITLKQKMGGINATLATVVSGALMILFFIYGDAFLKIMGLDVSSFAIAGSIVIFILALEMVLGLELFRHDSGSKSGSIVPIAFPMIAGSGTLTTIISLKAVYAYTNILIAILINLVFIFIILRSIVVIERWLGPNGIQVVRKFFGVILLAISIKIFRDNTSI